MILPVIIAGGTGSRLWPLSRSEFPKQFLQLMGNYTLLQNACNLVAATMFAPPVIICNATHRFIVAEQLRQYNMPYSAIILEPVSRNTAPAIALAALFALKTTDAKLLVLPADHLLEPKIILQQAISRATTYVNTGKLITFGIKPTTAETGYGYIKPASELSSGVFAIANFVEKPSLAKAQEYLTSGNYLYNSGIFLFKASSYLAELKKYAPAIVTSCQQALKAAYKDLDFIRICPSFRCCADISIDYAVMEHTSNALVVPLVVTWSDIGSWHAIWQAATKDSSGNVVKGDVLLEQTQNCYINAQNKLVATIGVDNLVIIETKDAILVANMQKTQAVKQLVAKLKDLKRTEYFKHVDTYQPWGWHCPIAQGANYHVRLLTIKASETTATQLRLIPAKNLLVVNGRAIIHYDTKQIPLAVGEALHVPAGIACAIANPAEQLLEIIEVRCGEYANSENVTRTKEYSANAQTKETNLL